MSLLFITIQANGDETAMNLSGAQNYFWNFFGETAANFREILLCSTLAI